MAAALCSIALCQVGFGLATTAPAAASGTAEGVSISPMRADATMTRARRVGTAELSGVRTTPTVRGSARAQAFWVNRTARVPASRRAALGPGAAGSTLTGSAPLSANFNAAGSLESLKVNGFDLEPPDQGLCVGGGEVVEAINLVLVVYATDGTKVIKPRALSSVFGEPTGAQAEFLTDPGCSFDVASGTFFLTLAAIDSTGAASHLDIGVLPAGSRSVTAFRVDTTDAAATGCPCFGDQPRLGLDAANVYVSSNEFSINGPAYDGAQIVAVSRAQLLAGLATPNVAQFRHLSVAAAPVLSVEPAITTGQAPAEYFANSFVLDGSGGAEPSDDRVSVWGMTNEMAVGAGGLPTLSAPAVVAVHRYLQPVGAVNPNGYVLDAGDDRLQQLQYIAGHLWAALDTTVVVNGTNTNHDGLAWMDLTPSASASGQVSASVAGQGRISVAGTDLLYPAALAMPGGGVAIGFSLTSQTLNPSVGYAQRSAGQAQFSAVAIAAEGTGPDNGFSCGRGPTCRWGDYSAAAIDPTTGRTWFGGEYIPPRASQSGSTFGETNWGTRIFAVD